jgi:hypothetical protein
VKLTAEEMAYLRAERGAEVEAKAEFARSLKPGKGAMPLFGE